MSQTCGDFGIALGVATLGSLATAVYRHRLADTLPSGVPPGAARAARESIAGSAAAAAHLPGRLGPQLLGAARTAFTSGLTTAAAVGGCLFIGLAVLATTILRPVRPEADETAAQPEPIPVSAAERQTTR
jgi:DHA2 family multidrug resistance protein-like MFS transporter